MAIGGEKFPVKVDPNKILISLKGARTLERSVSLTHLLTLSHTHTLTRSLSHSILLSLLLFFLHPVYFHAIFLHQIGMYMYNI